MNDIFLMDEVRSGYYVSSDIKRLWAVQLDLLGKFDEFCTIHSIRYYANGGTLLGAVRHHGFIPWDDDIDVMMLWEDYQVLLKEGPAFFTGKYFLQNYLTEKEGEPQLSKLRRSDTTGCTKWERECVSVPYNKGIFIDIFPIFNVPDEEDKRLRQIEEIGYYWKLYKGYEVNREKQLNNGVSRLEKQYDEYEKLYLTRFPRISFPEIKEKYVEICAKAKERTSLVAPLSFRANNPRTTWPRVWFDEIVYLPFEDTMIPCPKGFKGILDYQYGNWQEPIIGTAMHELNVVDTETPYIEKLNINQDIPPLVREYSPADYEGLKILVRNNCDAETLANIEQLQRMSAEEHIFVAETNDNTLVGCAFFRVEDGLGRDKTAVVTYIAVGKGCEYWDVKKRLLSEMEKTARCFGCFSIILVNAVSDSEEKKTYEALQYMEKESTIFKKILEE